MTCTGVWELLSYWGSHPPPHIVLRDLAQGFAGIEYGKALAVKDRQQSSTFKPSSKEEVLEFVNAVQRR
jgi:hypothetical protein